MATAGSLYDAARIVGAQLRKVAEIDRQALERDDYRFNVHFIIGGQIKAQPPGLFLIYPQGNPLQATEDAPFLQIGEVKYGRPILDRGIRYDRTTLEEAAKYALLSLDSTMKSNVTVGPPIDMLAYSNDEFDVTRHRRFEADDPALVKIRTRWDQALRQAVLKLPDIRFSAPRAKPPTEEETIQVVDNPQSAAAETTSPQPAAQQAQGAAKPDRSRPSPGQHDSR